MRIAVVGAAGFVGRHTVRKLRGGGHEILSVDRRPAPREEPGESFVIADLSTPSGAESAASECGPVDGIVWLAASIRQRAGVDETAEEDLAVMVQAPLIFLGSLPRPPGAFVFLSSVQVYGIPKRLPVDESHPTDPFTAYGAAKLCAEHYLRIRCDEAGTAFAALRPAFVYGPGQHASNVLPRFIEAARRGDPPVVHGPGADVRDDVFVGDVAAAVERALSLRARGSFNVASGRPHTLLDVAEAVCRLAGGDLRPRHEPVPSGWVDRWYDVSQARRVLGFEAATSFEEGLEAMWRASETA